MGQRGSACGNGPSSLAEFDIFRTFPDLTQPIARIILINFIY